MREREIEREREQREKESKERKILIEKGRERQGDKYRNEETHSKRDS